jgi:hypothetical protein
VEPLQQLGTPLNITSAHSSGTAREDGSRAVGKAFVADAIIGFFWQETAANLGHNQALEPWYSSRQPSSGKRVPGHACVACPTAFKPKGETTGSLQADVSRAPTHLKMKAPGTRMKKIGTGAVRTDAGQRMRDWREKGRNRRDAIVMEQQ